MYVHVVVSADPISPRAASLGRSRHAGPRASMVANLRRFINEIDSRHRFATRRLGLGARSCRAECRATLAAGRCRVAGVRVGQRKQAVCGSRRSLEVARAARTKNGAYEHGLPTEYDMAKARCPQNWQIGLRATSVRRSEAAPADISTCLTASVDKPAGSESAAVIGSSRPNAAATQNHARPRKASLRLL